MKRILISVVIFLAYSLPAGAGCRNYLDQEDLKRVRESKPLISQVDQRSLQRMIDELEETDCPPMNAVILEAMAKTFDDIVRDQKITDQEKEDFLYSKIKLNMAYLQLTGGQIKGDKDPLNRLIRFKLKEYLTDDVLTDPRFFHKVEELLE